MPHLIFQLLAFESLSSMCITTAQDRTPPPSNFLHHHAVKSSGYLQHSKQVNYIASNTLAMSQRGGKAAAKGKKPAGKAGTDEKREDALQAVVSITACTPLTIDSLTHEPPSDSCRLLSGPFRALHPREAKSTCAQYHQEPSAPMPDPDPPL